MCRAFSSPGGRLQEFRLGEGDWTFAVVVAVVTIQLLYKEVLETTPPAKFAPMRVEYLVAMSLYYPAIDDLTNGLDNLDAAKVTLSGETMKEADKKIQEATKPLMAAFVPRGHHPRKGVLLVGSHPSEQFDQTVQSILEDSAFQPMIMKRYKRFGNE